MNKAMKNIMIRVIKSRIQAGEKLDDILVDYPRMTKNEKKELKEAIA